MCGKTGYPGVETCNLGLFNRWKREDFATVSTYLTHNSSTYTTYLSRQYRDRIPSSYRTRPYCPYGSTIIETMEDGRGVLGAPNLQTQTWFHHALGHAKNVIPVLPSLTLKKSTDLFMFGTGGEPRWETIFLDWD